MSSSKVYSYHELVNKILDCDSRFEIKHGGKHPKIYHPDVDGSKRSFPIPFHGKNKAVPKGYYKEIVRRFNLPDDFFD